MSSRLPDSIASAIPIIQIRPNCIIEYLECIRGSSRSVFIDHISEAQEAVMELYGGEMTPAAAKRLKKAVNLLIMSSPRNIIYNPVTQKWQPFQLGFLTLTVSSKYEYLTAASGYERLLKHFLQWLRRTEKCNSYVWKAELQQRGQIHYHLTIGKFIVHDRIRKKWNELQRREGLLKEFEEEYGHSEPNSIDIHSVISVNDLAAYLCKYLAKEQDSDPIMKVNFTNDTPMKEEESWGNILSCIPENTVHKVRTTGKIWDCSKNLKKKKYWNTVMMPAHKWTLDQAKEAGITKVIEGDRYRIHIMNGQNPLEILSPTERENFDKYMKVIRDNSEEKEE